MPTLHWLNDEEARKQAGQLPYRLLEADPKLSYGDSETENMLIQGDNLEALKALLPYYAGQVKCIYIDPPYNTENAFEHYDDNLEHSIWLRMMYPRLELLRDFLSDDGSIWISIDDNEIGYLIAITDEIFGRRNRIFIATFKQSSASGPKAINPGVVSTCSYVLCYAKNKSKWKNYKVFAKRQRDDRYSKIIQNFDKNHDEWKFESITDAFEKSLKSNTKKSINNIEEKIHSFVIANANRVVRTARVAPEDVNESARKALFESQKKPNIVMKEEANDRDPRYFLNGEQLIFYSGKLRVIDGAPTTAEPLTNLWDDLLSNNLHNEGGVSFKEGKKPEALIKRILQICTDPEDLVLDSFLGSGTTVAVAHKMERRWIGIEMGNQCISHCVPRTQKVIDGEQSGVSKSLNWRGGGGFHFYRLGETVFDEQGHINEKVKFKALAAHVWFSETHTPLLITPGTPLIGIHNKTAYYLLYNGILGDTDPKGGNVLTPRVLRRLLKYKGKKVIYGEMSMLEESILRNEEITFKHIPYDIKAR